LLQLVTDDGIHRLTICRQEHVHRLTGQGSLPQFHSRT
jgi:hypothetical protein